MSRIPIDPKITTFTIRMSLAEAESLRKCAEALGVKKATILMRGLKQAEVELAKRKEQAAVEK